MVWRFPQKPTGEKRDSQWASTVTDEMMDKVSRGMCTSTYQTDYLGLPQGTVGLEKGFPKTNG